MNTLQPRAPIHNAPPEKSRFCVAACGAQSIV
jgi:hypothetical protein